MKNQTSKTAVLILTLVALVAAVPAFGANPVRAHIPFAFEAGSQSLPAGQYVFERALNGAFLYVQSVDRNGRIALGVTPEGNPNSPREPQIVFERIGSTYRLAEVWVANSAVGMGIQPTPQQMLMAKKFGPPQRVVVALVRK
jgi:hypothetical protein